MKAVAVSRGEGLAPSTSHQDQYSNSSKFDEKLLVVWVRELLQDFEMGMATRLRNNPRAWHLKSSPF